MGGKEPTTLRMWALAIARALESEGVDTRAALEAAGLVPPDNPDVDARCPVAAMTRVWQAAAASSGNPAIGLRVAAHVQPASMHALGLTLLVSGTLDEMIRRMERYSRIVTEALVIRIRRQSDRVTVSYATSPHGALLTHEAFDAFLGLSVKLGRMLGGPNVHPLEVELMRPRPKDAGPYLEWFRAPSVPTATDSTTTQRCSTGRYPRPIPAWHVPTSNCSSTTCRASTGAMSVSACAVRSSVGSARGARGWWILPEA